MSRALIQIIILVATISCSNNNISNMLGRIKGKPYYTFDKVEHYSIDISLNDAVNLYTTYNPTQKQVALSTILLDDTIEFIDSLTYYGFSKKLLDTTSNHSIRQIFSENNCRGDEFACAPIYRDIIIFKLKGKTTGIAKICFKCEKYHIEGSSLEPNNFGQCGDFGKLYKILYNK